MTALKTDAFYMARAIQLADKPEFSPHPNPRVGCVIVKNDIVVGEGFHQVAGGPHAEVYALKQAGELAKDSTVYVSLEPCCFQGRTPPCVNALIQAQVKKVIIGMLDPNPKVAGKGAALLEQAGIIVESNISTAEATKINRGFVQRMTLGRPWVRCKIAMSLDGRTAMANGESQWITGKEARQDVQRYRAKSDVILTGVGTVLADNPRMTVRGIETTHSVERQPLRVIVDSQLRSTPDLSIFRASGDALVATRSETKVFDQKNVTTQSFPDTKAGVDLAALMTYLAEQEINEVQVEAGARLNGALLNAGLVDELVLYMATVIMGDSARGLFALPELQSMTDKITFRCLEVRQVGENFRFTLQPEY